jgi:predicted MFS family arabinose efflux permease
MMQGAAVLLITVVFFVSPWFIDRLGPPGFFVILAGLSAVMVVTILACAPAVSFSRTVKARVTRVIKLVPLMGCVAVVALFTGQGTIGTYIITIGNAAGFDSHTLSTVLAVSLPVGLLGPIAARALGARVGLVRTLLLALLLLAISDLLVVKTRSLIAFSLLYAGLGLLVEFCVPYAIALLSRLDQLGRAASAAPACMIGGLAIGPALGARVVAGATDFQTLAFVSASCVAAAVALFAISAGLSGSPQEDCEPHGRGFTKGFEAAAAVTGPSDRKA